MYILVFRKWYILNVSKMEKEQMQKIQIVTNIDKSYYGNTKHIE